jgi:ATP-dependent RNA helicase HelY
LNDLRRRFLDHLPFPPDPFQAEAMDSLDAGRSVLVSAPTGSGKTLVAAYAVGRALAAGGKAFYTTPLKALSNQKFGELVAEHGPSRVGLLTGDTAIRPEAAAVVMTTEVLRNMLLAGSDLLTRLHTVVLDEVHYLQDPYRGGVWEEVLVLCPPEVTFVCLSATVGNAADLAEWLRSVRGPTDLVIESERPVELRHHFAVARRGRPRHDGEPVELMPLLADGRVAGEGLRVDEAVRRAVRAGTTAGWRAGGRGRRPDLPYRSPRRTEMVDALEDADLLPAIVFIFSRAACGEAVRQCLNDGVQLTTGAQRAEIRRIADAHTEGLSDEDLGVLGHPEWMEGLEAGVTAHHAGLVPAFREAVETCFAAGLLSVVFATETLSLGINMPARTAVIERFTKFGGAGRATLTSGEYAQLTGRAGRRGLDAEGHAVVCWTGETTFADVARVALAPPPDLRSSFRPTYNLAVNLVARFDRPTALGVLRRSFAQWQASARERAAGRARGDGERETLVEHLGRRLAVLEELGYVDGWRLTDAGRRLARIYHDADLLVAEAVSGEALTGAEPSVLAGVLSSLVFERRRARRTFTGPERPGRARPGRPARSAQGKGAARRGQGGDRLGAGRRADLAGRLAVLVEAGEIVRATEEIHLVPRMRQPEPGLAGAVAAWCRGASFGTVLDVAARDVGEIAPGDFVRTAKQVADLVSQVALVTDDPATAAAADAAVGMLLRDVVAGAPPPSATDVAART